jgi:aminotransferase
MTSAIRPARRIQNIPFSGIRKILGRATEHERSGQKVIHLEIGRPDFDTPIHIKEAAKKALDRGYVHYTPNDGILPLREAIADELRKQNGVAYDPNTEIIVTVGAAQAIYLAFVTFLDSDDEILVPEPAWMNYIHSARLVDAKPVLVPLRPENGFQLDPEDLERATSRHTKMLILNSPHNPTGAVFRRDTLEKIAALVAQHDLLVISDEVYSRLIYDGEEHLSFASLPGMGERTITVNAFSKTYSMTGWRLGYVAAPREFAQAMIKVHQYSVTSVTSFAQYGAVAAYTGPQDDANKMLAEFDRRRQLIVEGLRAIRPLSFVSPKGGFYVFPSVQHLGMDGDEFASFMLDEYFVALVPGSVFGPRSKHFIRISYSTSYEDLQEALVRLKQACRRLTE